MAVVNTVAVTNVQIALGAVPPDRELHEPGKGLRECSVEAPGIDPGRDRLDNVGAAVRSVAGGTVRMVGTEPVQDAGAVQKIVHRVLTAIMLAPTSGHSGLLLASSRLDSVIITTLSATPWTWRNGPTKLSINLVIRFGSVRSSGSA